MVISMYLVRKISKSLGKKRLDFSLIRINIKNWLIAYYGLGIKSFLGWE
jgi:hypothetical protein